MSPGKVWNCFAALPIEIMATSNPIPLPPRLEKLMTTLGTRLRQIMETIEAKHITSCPKETAPQK